MIIVSYDFKSDKVRAQFAKFLKKYGRRIQYSVYEIKNSQRILQNILTVVKYQYKNKFKKTDSILIFSLCKNCITKIKRYGYAANEEKEIVFFD